MLSCLLQSLTPEPKQWQLNWALRLPGLCDKSTLLAGQSQHDSDHENCHSSTKGWHRRHRLPLFCRPAVTSKLIKHPRSAGKQGRKQTLSELIETTQYTVGRLLDLRLGVLSCDVSSRSGKTSRSTSKSPKIVKTPQTLAQTLEICSYQRKIQSHCSQWTNQSINQSVSI